MTVLKTRAKLVDVARQLFAKKGVEDTTMNDIAQASKKGRRTLYTYFKSKEQIYMAVVESELEMLSTQMEKAASKPVSPDKKILELIMTHLDAIKMVVYRNGTLRADFFRDIGGIAGFVGNPHFHAVDGDARGEIRKFLHPGIIMVSEILGEEEVAVLLIIGYIQFERSELYIKRYFNYGRIKREF